MRLILSLLLILLPSFASAASLSVFAASSLTEALHEIADLWEQQPGAEPLTLNFAGSQALAAQIERGAPADLLISANQTAIQRLQDAGLISPPRLLLSNQLMLATRADLEPAITSLHDLGRTGLLLAIGNPQVPVGAYTRRLFANLAADAKFGPELVAAIRANVVSEETNVKAIIAKLQLGEVDAGIVYRSDLAANNAAQLGEVELPDEDNPRAIYPVARVRGGQPQAEQLLEFLFSPAAQQIFARHGFGPGATK